MPSHLQTHRTYLGALWSHAVRHADASGAAWQVIGLILLVLGLGGVVNGLTNVVPGGGLYSLFGFVGLYMVGKSVWDGDQAAIAQMKGTLDEQAAIRPLRIAGTDHKGKWRRFVVENPNSFVVSGSYVQVEDYRSLQPLDWEKYSLPERGFRFNWGTQQNNPNGNLGARDTLIIDIAEKRNGDHFAHAAPADGMHKYTPFLPLPYGRYQIDLSLGASSTAMPVGHATIEIAFSEEEFTVASVNPEERSFDAFPDEHLAPNEAERQSRIIADLNEFIAEGEYFVQAARTYKAGSRTHVDSWEKRCIALMEHLDATAFLIDFRARTEPKLEQFKGVALGSEGWIQLRSFAAKVEVLRELREAIASGQHTSGWKIE